MTTCPCPLLAQSGHYLSVEGCPLLGVKRTSTAGVPMSANDPTRTSSSLPKPLRQWQAQAHEVSPHDDVAGNPTFFRCFLRVSFRERSARNLEWLRGNSPRSFPRRRDHCRGASFQRCKAPNPHLPRRPWPTNRKTIHRLSIGSGLNCQLSLGYGGASLWPQSS